MNATATRRHETTPPVLRPLGSIPGQPDTAEILFGEVRFTVRVLPDALELTEVEPRPGTAPRFFQVPRKWAPAPTPPASLEIVYTVEITRRDGTQTLSATSHADAVCVLGLALTQRPDYKEFRVIRETVGERFRRNVDSSPVMARWLLATLKGK